MVADQPEPKSRAITAAASLAVALLLLALGVAEAQTTQVDSSLEVSTGPAPDSAVAPAPEGDHATPRRAVVGYLMACNEGDFDRAAIFLDLGTGEGSLRPEAGPRLARRLKIVLDRVFWVNPELISDDPGGAADRKSQQCQARRQW